LLKQEFPVMSESQLRVKLLVAAGIVGASLLAASFVGCSSGPPSQSSAPFASYNGSPMFNGANGPQAPPYPGGQAAAPGVSGYSQQNREAFMQATQQAGAQQGLTAQDVVAMSRAGMPDAQIAMAVQQRGQGLKSTPGADQFLAANGVNPAVLNGPTQQLTFAPYGSRMMPGSPNTNAAPGYPAGMQVAQAGAPGAAGGPMPFGTQGPISGGPSADPGVQSAGYQTPGGSGADPSAAGESWRPMAH
jgi:hypothetical protein